MEKRDLDKGVGLDFRCLRVGCLPLRHLDSTLCVEGGLASLWGEVKLKKSLPLQQDSLTSCMGLEVEGWQTSLLSPRITTPRLCHSPLQVFVSGSDVQVHVALTTSRSVEGTERDGEPETSVPLIHRLYPKQQDCLRGPNPVLHVMILFSLCTEEKMEVKGFLSQKETLRQ